MTWNLWWRFGPWEERFDAIVATISAENPDVICLQELWASDGSISAVADQVEMLAEALGMYSARTQSPFWNGFSFGNAVLSRWPISDPITHVLPDHQGKASHRRALLCTVTPDTPSASNVKPTSALDPPRPIGPFKVVSTHFEFRFDRSATRQAQSISLAQLVAEHRGDPELTFPVIVGADTNALPDSDEMRLLLGLSPTPVRGLIFHDCWALAGNETPGYTWSDRNPYLANASWPRRRIDYLLVSWPRAKGQGTPTKCWNAGTAPINGIMPSDHFAVVADLRE
jgi:endonuclease/exonuclease/phosphatase family metal-dependent hydrolase